ncbi:hypothetical protein [Castellaniella sp. GW247-6E4]|uniref:hypothetical protein n=1 Tax=Castellaniella sp. GW247-6E4 TaxID=3140380 RepID=UPI003315375D
MRERLDCAVLAVGREAWVASLMGPHAGGRLHLHAPWGAHGDAAMLEDAALSLGRYDACLLYVDGAGLGAWRTALAATRPPGAHLIAYAVDLRAQAIHDLYALGVADFIRPPFCAESLRARIERLLDGAAPPAPVLAEGDSCYGLAVSPGGPVDEDALCATILQRSGAELEAYAVAVASRQASSRESFREAKGRVIERFERAYIHAALGRHRGNIAMAARAAQKHRRAFWALMRKHDIDPAPYRAEASPRAAPDG